MWVACPVRCPRALAFACVLFSWPAVSAQSLTCSEMEEFLHLGKIGPQKNIPKGVTLPTRATLEVQQYAARCRHPDRQISRKFLTKPRGVPS